MLVARSISWREERHNGRTNGLGITISSMTGRLVLSKKQKQPIETSARLSSFEARYGVQNLLTSHGLRPRVLVHDSRMGGKQLSRGRRPIETSRNARRRCIRCRSLLDGYHGPDSGFHAECGYTLAWRHALRLYRLGKFARHQGHDGRESVSLLCSCGSCFRSRSHWTYSDVQCYGLGQHKCSRRRRRLHFPKGKKNFIAWGPESKKDIRPTAARTLREKQSSIMRKRMTEMHWPRRPGFLSKITRKVGFQKPRFTIRKH